MFIACLGGSPLLKLVLGRVGRGHGSVKRRLRGRVGASVSAALRDRDCLELGQRVSGVGTGPIQVNPGLHHPQRNSRQLAVRFVEAAEGKPVRPRAERGRVAHAGRKVRKVLVLLARLDVAGPLQALRHALPPLRALL